MNPDRREAVREAGEKYGTMAADLSLVHISMASSEEAVQGHISDLVRNIREQAAQQAREDLAIVWKEAALKAAQARLEAFGGSGADDHSLGRH
jgi:acetoin utilization deacetylase AcuC-like enzyme